MVINADEGFSGELNVQKFDVQFFSPSFMEDATLMAGLCAPAQFLCLLLRVKLLSIHYCWCCDTEAAAKLAPETTSNIFYSIL